MPKWKVTIKGWQTVWADTEEEAMEHQDIGCPNNVEYIEAELIDER